MASPAHQGFAALQYVQQAVSSSIAKLLSLCRQHCTSPHEAEYMLKVLLQSSFSKAAAVTATSLLAQSWTPPET